MNTKHTAFGFDVIIDETLSPSEWELRQVRKQDTNHTDSVEAIVDKMLAIGWDSKMKKHDGTSIVVSFTKAELCDLLLNLQATQSQQVEEAVREAYEAGRMFAYNEALEACDFNEFSGQIRDDIENKIRRPDIYETRPSPLQALLTPNHQD